MPRGTKGQCPWREGESPPHTGERERAPHAQGAVFLPSDSLEAVTDEVRTLELMAIGIRKESRKMWKESHGLFHRGDECMKTMGTLSLAARSSSPPRRDKHINKPLQNNSVSSKYQGHKGLGDPEEEEAASPAWEGRERLCAGDS